MNYFTNGVLTAPSLMCLFFLAGCNDSSTSTPESSEQSQLESSQSEKAEENTVTPAAFYAVAVYDEESNPADDLAMTVEKAQRQSKRILIQAGGDWCRWCKLIEKFMTNNQEVRDLLEKHYLIMKVASKGEVGEAFLAEYPEIPGYPHFFVLENDGSLLHSQPTAELELEGQEEEGYDTEVFLEFLRKWLPDAAMEKVVNQGG